MKHIISTILLCTCANVFAQSPAVEADSAYNRENYSEAINLYSEALTVDGPSTTLYYNLGNAYYRDNKLGKAVLSYERALALDPSNKDARTNLEFLRSRMEDAPEDDSSFLSNVHKNILALLSPDAWAIVAVALFVILLATIALYIFSSNITFRKLGFFGSFLFAIVFIYSLVIACQSTSAHTRHNHAVVIVPTTNLSSAPRSTRSEKEKVVPIHEGTKVEIIDSLSTPDDANVGKWYDVKINNSSRAWLNAADVERI